MWEFRRSRGRWLVSERFRRSRCRCDTVSLGRGRGGRVARQVGADESGPGWLRVQAGPLRKSPISWPICLGFCPMEPGFSTRNPWLCSPGRINHGWRHKPSGKYTGLLGRGGALVVDASSKNHAVSVWSETDPPRGHDESSQCEKVVLPRAIRRRPADAAYVRTMGFPNLIVKCRAVLQLVHQLHLGGFQRLRGIPAKERT
jgi:hypothetical protein